MLSFTQTYAKQRPIILVSCYILTKVHILWKVNFKMSIYYSCSIFHGHDFVFTLFSVPLLSVPILKY